MILLKRALLSTLLILLLATLSLAAPANAQAELRVQILALDFERFPTVSLSVSVTDPTGAYIPDLPPTVFQILEDNFPMPGLVMREERIGTQQVFVINDITGLSMRLESGESQYGLIQEALLEWWARSDASEYGLDDLTLITNEADLATHVSSAAVLGAKLDQYEPSFEIEDDSADLLVRALTLATDAPPRPGMPRHLIFVTPYIYSMVDLPLANVIARANEAQTAVHVVFAAPEQALSFIGVDGLQQLASETGGIFLHFDAAEGLAPITEQVLTQRELYELNYTSHANTSGPHSVSVRVSDEDAEGISPAQAYEIAVEAPDLAFIRPPTIISRQPSDPDNPIETLAPTSETLQLLITFPDEHPRAITSTWLVVDGEVMDHRSQAPLDEFTWDLSEYMESGMHIVKAVAQDILGLEGTSIENQIFVDVPPPPSGLSAIRPALSSLLAALAVLVAGVVLAITLLNMGQRNQAASAVLEERPPRSKIRVSRASLQPPEESLSIDAHLVPIEHTIRDVKPVPLTGAELTLGRDASLSAVAIEDPSVSSIHARLIRRAGGSYFIRDQGSVAGTWINYEQVGEEGRELKHGDLIHLGRVAFRFELKHPPLARRARTSPESEPN